MNPYPSMPIPIRRPSSTVWSIALKPFSATVSSS
jgi:hypothetical protein